MSEQISTAGKEASGTGNMKFMINGALTIGTLDGANVEMRDEVGAENFFLFGLTESEVEAVKAKGYRPADYIDGNDELRAVLDLIADGTFSHGDTEVFKPLVDNLRYDDPFLVCADFASYIAAQEQVGSGLAGQGRVDEDVHPEHRPQRQVLLGPRDRRVLRRDLECVAAVGDDIGQLDSRRSGMGSRALSSRSTSSALSISAKPA